jgi:NADH-quinone oxidoreductase subunit N
VIMIPELIVLLCSVLVLVFDMLLDERKRVILAPMAGAGPAVALAAMVLVVPSSGSMLGGRFVMDPVAWWFKVVFLLSGVVTVLLSRDLLDGRVEVRVRGIGFRGEYYAVLLATLTGMMALISARDMIALYVSLELATIPLFVLAAWQRDDALSSEAGLKYVLMGAMASAFIVYGLGLLYGLSGSTELRLIGGPVQGMPAFWLAIAMLIAGMGFKLTLVPFHFWAADVYQGAPVPVTAYLSVASKGAGLAFAFQIVLRMMPELMTKGALGVALFAAAAMTLGNTMAIVQQDIKRFMAFSTISQAGNLILGFVGGLAEGVPAMLYYLLVYAVTNFAVFACILWYSNTTGRQRIEDYRGLSRTNPVIALAMMLGLFSLAGIPPLSGFVGKFFLFSVASKAGFHWLVAVAAVNSTISLYYYLRIVRQMYIEGPPTPSDAFGTPAPADEPARRLPITATLGLTLAVLIAGIVLMGIVPSLYETISAQTLSFLAR